MIVPVEAAGALDRAAAALSAGEAIVVPTDTVYGIAVDAFLPGATGRVFAAKQRPHSVDLPVLVAEPDDVWRLVADVPPAAAALIERWWPGPLTIVLRRRPRLDLDLGDRVDTVGVRCPASDVVRALARAVGPLATTSANRHGEPTPPTAAGVALALPGVSIVLDGGVCDGAPSTVVDVTTGDVVVLREGAADLTGGGR